ncbi:MAG: discoidin domain-containing protein [Candidatus Kryptoniota bacterium]
MIRFHLFIVFSLLLLKSLNGQTILLDNFDSLRGWHGIASGGVKLSLIKVPGVNGSALGIRFNFTKGTGYAIAEKDFNIDLSANYRFTFWYRGKTPLNNFEFKLIDSAGNVFWIKQLNLDYPKKWTMRAIRKKDISFAWGPSGGGYIKKVAKIQFVVSAGKGGSGIVYIDDFKLQTLPPDSTHYPWPKIAASSFSPRHPPGAAIDTSLSTYWQSSSHHSREWLLLDCQSLREVGGITIDWHGSQFAENYAVELSDNGKMWSIAYRVDGGNGGVDNIYLPETLTRFIKLVFLKPHDGSTYAVASVRLRSAEFASSLNSFFDSLAEESPVGWYPAYFYGRQSYWTLVGINGDSQSGLMNEQGQIEVCKSGFSLEPFLYIHDSLITWAEVNTTQTLLDDYLPVPSVIWKNGSLELKITAFGVGTPDSSAIIARYSVKNCGSDQAKGKLFLAIRPFQVNPPWQFLNNPGGVTNITNIGYKDGVVKVNNGKRFVIPLTRSPKFGATTFDHGEIIEYLSRGILPRSKYANDHFGCASGALEYDFLLKPGDEREFDVLCPFHDRHLLVNPNRKYPLYNVSHQMDCVKHYWEDELNRTEFNMPDSEKIILNTIRTNLAYILISRNGYALQPGSRAYDRSWIRDGALISAALLRFGFTKEVKEYIDWYSKFIGNNGNVPCVVDSRGADPVPENDSHGEFIYAIMQYFNFTHDTSWLRQKLPVIKRVVNYINYLRSQRMTAKYIEGSDVNRACYGLVPESISHEGYSNNPEHSYWDDFFTFLGLKDAARIAYVLGDSAMEVSLKKERDKFEGDLIRSIELSMQLKKIPYIPGCVELGDFDPTSTSIGVDPVGMYNSPLRQAFKNTFEKYYEYFKKRKNNEINWTDYTPYEMRIIGSLIQMDEPARGYELLNYFMSYRRPETWNGWAEVVWKDRNAPRFIGDLPHAWVGAEFLRSVRAFFIYEDDSTLHIGAGIPLTWLNYNRSISVKNIPTYYGKISYQIYKSGNCLKFIMHGGQEIKHFAVVVHSPEENPIKDVNVQGAQVQRVDGKAVTLKPQSTIIVLRLYY